MRMLSAVLVLALGCFISAPGFAQSIGPDGRVLPVYSGRQPGVIPPTTTTPAPAPAPAALIRQQLL